MAEACTPCVCPRATRLRSRGHHPPGEASAQPASARRYFHLGAHPGQRYAPVTSVNIGGCPDSKDTVWGLPGRPFQAVSHRVPEKINAVRDRVQCIGRIPVRADCIGRAVFAALALVVDSTTSAAGWQGSNHMVDVEYLAKVAEPLVRTTGRRRDRLGLPEQ